MAGSETTATPAQDPGIAPLAKSLAGNLRRYRLNQGLSVERLATLSGVDTRELATFEAGSGTPSIAQLWKISTVLEIPFSSLFSEDSTGSARVLRATDAKLLTSRDGGFTSRALFPFEGERQTEFYELRLAPGVREHAEPHAPGTIENLTVAGGTVEILTGDGLHRLEKGDSIQFEADTPHGYHNPTDVEAVLYLVVSYTGSIGA